MRRVFVDTAYYVAIVLPTDDLHTAATATARALDDAAAITTEGVLTELLAYFADRGPTARATAVHIIDEVQRDAATELVHQTPELFLAAVELYRQRPDKGYSLTDCMSMVVCTQAGITEVLTHDRHFTQEGFTILL